MKRPVYILIRMIDHSFSDILENYKSDSGVAGRWKARVHYTAIK